MKKSVIPRLAYSRVYAIIPYRKVEALWIQGCGNLKRI